MSETESKRITQNIERMNSMQETHATGKQNEEPINLPDLMEANIKAIISENDSRPKEEEYDDAQDTTIQNAFTDEEIAELEAYYQEYDRQMNEPWPEEEYSYSHWKYHENDYEDDPKQRPRRSSHKD